MNATETRPPVLFNNLGDEPVHRAIRRLRWFKSSFISQVNSVSEQTGITFETNTEVLARCFLAWLKEFEARKPENSDEYEAFVGFASGLMLRRLIELKPVRHLSTPEPIDKDDPAMFWPEGYVYVMYCLNIRKLVLDEAFSTELEISNVIPDINAWWSFRENVSEMSSYAIAFLDLFAGKQPDFDAPQVFSPGPAVGARSLPTDVRGNAAVAAPAGNDAHHHPQAGHVDTTLSTTTTATPTGTVSDFTRRSTQQPALPLAYGLQIGLQNARAVLVDSHGVLLYEQQDNIAFESGDALQHTHADLIDDLLRYSRTVIDALPAAEPVAQRAEQPAAQPAAHTSVDGSDASHHDAAATAAPNATVQGVFVALPDQLLGNTRQIRDSLRTRMNAPVTVMGTATAAAVAEIASGTHASPQTTQQTTAETSFLLIWVESTLETKLVLDGKIVTGATRSDLTTSNVRTTDARNAADSDTVAQHYQAESEFTELQNTIAVLQKMTGLQQIVLAPASARAYSQPLLKRLQLAFPAINTRFSDIPRTPEAFGAVCLQFTDVVRSEQLEPESH